MVSGRRNNVFAFLSWKGGPERPPQDGAPGRPHRLGVPQLISIVLRLIGLALVVSALILLGGDMLSSLDHDGQLRVRSLGTVWQWLGPDSLAACQAWLGSLSHRALNWLDSFLSLPGWGVTGVFGVLLAFLAGRHPHH